MVSILITALNEIYLEKTIRNILENAEGEIEVLVMLDGYLPPIDIGDKRVVFYHHEKPIGQRQSINELARHAKGEFLMKLDAHCAVDKGFDTKLAADCEPDWTVIPRMYNLDVDNWKPKLFEDTREAIRKGKLNDYMYIGHKDGHLRSLYYSGGERKRQHERTELIGDTMTCMGPGWFLRKDRYWELGGLDENHGGWGQMGVEMACKAWLSGGAMKVNKKTWFAHWFRGNIGFPYHLSQNSIDKARNYSDDLWLNDKWPLAKRKFKWMLDKFQPPTWHNVPLDLSKKMETNAYLFQHIHREKHPTIWKGVPILKMPTDMFLFHKVIWDTRPDYIVEIGTKYGGSALFMQDSLDMVGKGKVITIDIKPQVKVHDTRIIYLIGDSTSQEIINKVKELVGNGSVMLVIDGKHTRVKVKWELHHYSPLVKSGHYIVIEDCYNPPAPELYGPGEARDWFLRNYKDFKQTNLDDYFLVGFNIGGWLRRQ